MFSTVSSNMSIDIGGSCSILAFSVLASASVTSVNLKVKQYKEVINISIFKIVVKEELGPCERLEGSC